MVKDILIIITAIIVTLAWTAPMIGSLIGIVQRRNRIQRKKEIKARIIYELESIINKSNSNEDAYIHIKERLKKLKRK